MVYSPDECTVPSFNIALWKPWPIYFDDLPMKYVVISFLCLGLPWIEVADVTIPGWWYTYPSEKY